MFVCECCESQVGENYDYCPVCGTLFSEYACENHPEEEGVGICLICEKVCCPECGDYLRGMFLCEEHSQLEIYERMAKIFGSSDSVEIDFIISMLEKEGLHPVRFDRKNNPLYLGGSDYTLFRPDGDVNGHITNEIKILVPFVEYEEAVGILKEVETNQEER